MAPETVDLTGTANVVSGNTTVEGTGTKFDQEIVENDFVIFSGQTLQVSKINSPTNITLTTAPASSNAAATMTVSGLTDVWDNRFLKAYATAKIKMQWGSNLKKFAGIQMPGGVTLNGQQIYDEAIEEIKNLEEQMYNATSMPSEIFIG